MGKHRLHLLWRAVRLLVGVPIFLIADRCFRGARDTVLIITRKSVLDADTMPLVHELAHRQPSWKLVVVVDSREEFHEACDWFVQTLPSPVEVVERETVALVRALLRSFLVFMKNCRELIGYRQVGSPRARCYVRINHGIITKAFERVSTEWMSHQRNSNLAALLDITLWHVNVDVHCVASEVEKYYVLAAEGGMPRFWQEYGYPRYDRLEALQRGGEEPWLQAPGRELLEKTAGKKRILYAPTHKDERFSTSLFPVEGFDRQHFLDFLKSQDAVVFLRMHFNEEECGIYDEIVDDENVFYAGLDLALTATEIFPFVDVLITDYSSIYMDYLPMDRPIVFVKDTFDEFLQYRGFSFDYERYFPGPKVSSHAELLDQLGACLEGREKFQPQRQFVRDVLLPELPGSFLGRVLNDPAVKDRVPEADARTR